MSSNYQGRGGRGRGGGRSNYRGGGGGRSSGGRGRNSGGGGGGGRGQGGPGSSLFTPCSSYTTTGNCKHGDNCNFAHIVTLHKVFDASSFMQNNNNYHNQHNNYNNNNNNNNSNSRKHPISSVAIWEMNGAIQIFTGSHDGFWRMWNTANGAFSKQAETNMKGKVHCLQVFQNSYLYCGYEAPSKLLPDTTVGMVNAWNLQNTAQPLEFQVNAQQHLPYAHNQAVTALAIGGADANTSVVTGARDGSIRLWALQEGSFALVRTLPGHAREVTGLVLIPGGSLLWSSSVDGSIRIWDLSQTVPEKACQYCIARDTPGQVPSSTSGGNPQQNASGIGHSNAVTALVPFSSAGKTFILSSSLDGTIKAWDSSTGACVANETHTEGVVTMALADASANSPTPQPQQPPASEADKKQVLLIGLESGNIACRNLVQTPNVAAFQLLFLLSAKYTAAHSGAVKAITPGPAATFYTGGNDGNLMVWQFTGTLNI